jgi:hypothetical protein
MRTAILLLTGLLLANLPKLHAQSNPIPQTDKGQILVGGSISGFWRNASTEEKRSGSLISKSETKRRSIRLAPEASYFIDTNLAIGIEGAYRYRISISPKQPSVGDSLRTEDTRQTFSFGPTLRYYKPISDKLAFFGRASAYYELGKVQKEIGLTKVESDIMGFGGSVRPGITWFVSDKVGINFSIPRFVVYSYSEVEGTVNPTILNPNSPGTSITKSDESQTNSDLNFNLNLSRISVGVNVFL